MAAERLPACLDVAAGRVVKGTVTAIENDLAVIDVGVSSSGFIELIRNALYNSPWLEKPELVEIKTSSATNARDQRRHPVEQVLDGHPRRHGRERAEIVLGQVLDLDAAGQRLLDLLMVINGNAGDRRFGKEPLPSVRHVGAKVGHHGLDALGQPVRAEQDQRQDGDDDDLSEAEAEHGTGRL